MSFASLPNSTGRNDAIQPFTIHTPQEALDELKTLIQNSRIAVPTFENSRTDGKYGLDREWMLNIRDKWAKFDWTKTESRLNSFPHFKAMITDDDGTKYDIHFTALFSKKSDAVPLMMLHGWPGSFLEFMPIFQLLKDKYTPETLPYHAIVPSLPGYTFSSGPRRDEDFGAEDAARIFDRLMSAIGLGDAYVVQGGDIGSTVARYSAMNYHGCKALHLNMLIVPKPPPGTSQGDLSASEIQGLAGGFEFLKFGLGYALEHATRPSTIGLVLASSPMALMAWIGEKFHEWSDVTPSDETIMEFVTLYWITNTFERSIYTYRQDFPDGIATLDGLLSDAAPPSQPKSSVSGSERGQIALPYIDKPMGFSCFKDFPTPESWAASRGNLVFYRRHEKGGHFAALEQPELFLGDVEEFIGQIRADLQ